MSQKSYLTTTSFINSSTESLNKLPLSSSQSTVSSEYVTTGETYQGNLYSVSLNPLHNMLLNQSNSRIQAALVSSPSYPHQQSIYGSPITEKKSEVLINNQQPTNIQGSSEFINGATPNFVATDNQNPGNIQPSIVTSYSRLNNNVSTDTNQLRPTQAHPLADNKYMPINNSLTDEALNTSATRNLSTTTLNKLNNNKVVTNGTYTLKSNPSVKSFHNNKSSPNNQQTSLSSLDSSNSNTLLPLNVKSMLLHGVTGYEVIKTWLTSIKCEEYVGNFIDNGYDMPLLARMTPQDLTAIGCKSPAVRKKLLQEIKKLNLEDDIPSTRPYCLEQWLELLKLKDYYTLLCNEGYDTVDKVCELAWEDLEEIGITKLGHQKRLLLGIERLQKFDKQQEERQNDYAIYDVHPNHRISLHQNQSDRRLSTLGRSTVRSGFFQTRPGANLDHRGLPMATVTPAFKYVNNTLANLDISHQVISKQDSAKSTYSNSNGNSNNRLSINESKFQTLSTLTPLDNQMNGLSLNEPSVLTIKRNPPPLPPVRSNSLKIGPQDPMLDHANNIYGNDPNLVNQNGGNSIPTMPTSSNSFLRTPKLGNFTATTNKLLIHGGHIQITNNQSTAPRSIVPVREAPLPPTPAQTSNVPERIEEENSMPVASFPSIVGHDSSIMSSSPTLISHQLGSADEFPPPPPSQ